MYINSCRCRSILMSGHVVPAAPPGPSPSFRQTMIFDWLSSGELADLVGFAWPRTS